MSTGAEGLLRTGATNLSSRMTAKKRTRHTIINGRNAIRLRLWMVRRIVQVPLCPNRPDSPEQSNEQVPFLSSSYLPPATVVANPVAVEKLLFCQNSRNLRDSKCPSNRRPSFVGLPIAKFFLRVFGEGVFQKPLPITLIIDKKAKGIRTLVKSPSP